MNYHQISTEECSTVFSASDHPFETVIVDITHIATLGAYSDIKGDGEENSRLFPLDLSSETASGLWCKVTDWQADQFGRANPGSQRGGRVTEDFRAAPFFGPPVVGSI